MTSLTLLFGAIAAALGLTTAIAWWGARRPLVHRTTLSRVSSLLDELLRRGYAGGVLIISVPGTDLFVQFRKYIAAPHAYGLEYGFPRAGWSQSYFSLLLTALSAKTITFRREVAEDPWPEGVTEFVMVDCGVNVERAEFLTRLTVLEVFGCPENVELEARFQGVSVKDETISDPHV